MSLVDSHHHLWRIRSEMPWPAPTDPLLYRDIDWAELEPQLDQAGVDATVVVQTEDSDADTDFLLCMAGLHPRIAGVVGWLPLDQPARAAERLAELTVNPRFVGVRCLIHHMRDDAWLARREVEAGLTILEKSGIPFDVVSDRPAQLAHVAPIAARHPDLRLVIDHLSKPPIGGDTSHWQQEITAAAQHPNVYAKLSGLYPPPDARQKLGRDPLRPYMDLALQLFGTERLMLGSDWPVCTTAGSYGSTWAALRSFADELAPAERVALLGGTASKFYGLSATRR